MAETAAVGGGRALKDTYRQIGSVRHTRCMYRRLRRGAHRRQRTLPMATLVSGSWTRYSLQTSGRSLPDQGMAGMVGRQRFQGTMCLVEVLATSTEEAREEALDRQDLPVLLPT